MGKEYVTLKKSLANVSSSESMHLYGSGSE